MPSNHRSVNLYYTATNMWNLSDYYQSPPRPDGKKWWGDFLRVWRNIGKAHENTTLCLEGRDLKLETGDENCPVI